MVLTSARCNAATGQGFTTLTFNGNTSNIYSQTVIRNQGGTPSSFAVSAQGGILYIATPDTTNTANTFSNTSIYISNYASSSYKAISLDIAKETNQATNDSMNEMMSALFSSTTAISSITLNASSFVQYSSVTLYGITKG